MLTRAASRVTGRTRPLPPGGSGLQRGGDPAGSPVWPLAVGAVIAPVDYSGRTRSEDRLSLALGAYRLGYFLLDLIDVPAWPHAEDDDAWAPVWDLAARAGAEAVVIYPLSGSDLHRAPALPSGMSGITIRMLRTAD